MKILKIFLAILSMSIINNWDIYSQKKMTIDQAFKNLKEIQARAIERKGEFETTKDFESRSEKHEAKKISEIYSLLRQTYDGNPRVWINDYNADRETLSITIFINKDENAFGGLVQIFKSYISIKMPMTEAKNIKENFITKDFKAHLVTGDKASVSGKFVLEENGSIYQDGRIIIKIGSKTYQSEIGEKKISIIKKRVIQNSNVLGADGNLLAYYSKIDKKIRIIDITSGDIIYVLTGEYNNITLSSFCWDTKKLAIYSSTTKEILLLDVTTGKILNKIIQDVAYGLNFSSDAERFVFVDKAPKSNETKMIKIIETNSGKELYSNTYYFGNIKLNSDGSKLALWGFPTNKSESGVWVWEFSKGVNWTELPRPKASSTYLSPDLNKIVSFNNKVSGGQLFLISDASSGKILKEIKELTTSNFNYYDYYTFLFNPTGNILVSGNEYQASSISKFWHNYLKFWSINNAMLLTDKEYGINKLDLIGFSQDGKTFINCVLTPTKYVFGNPTEYSQNIIELFELKFMNGFYENNNLEKVNLEQKTNNENVQAQVDNQKTKIINKEVIKETVIDIDGNVYNTVTIGTQTWMVENLKVTKFRNGEAIPNVTEAIDWKNLTNSAWCNYNNNPDSAKIFGRLYNWFAVNDSRNIAPTGWHVPSDDEWTTLTNYLGGAGVAGGKLKEAGTSHWQSPNTGATNESGFTSFPGSYRDLIGTFGLIGEFGYYWTLTEYNKIAAFSRSQNYNYSGVARLEYGKNWGFSVRCVKD
jgi:uncharacterized protein (TIGR02145 family)